MDAYVSIEKVREKDIVVDDFLTLKSNVESFREGDIISVTEKIDGAQTYIMYDEASDRLRCFSSKSELSSKNTLRGFYDYVQTLDVEPFKKYPNYKFYGEWLVPHTVKYDEKNYNKWFLFSVKNSESESYLPQSFVKGFATKYQFNYPHELYFGPFLGWDHVYSLANSPYYGRTQEGVVIKNQTALEQNRFPFVLKYVNESFVETKIQNHIRKVTDQNYKKEKSEAEVYIRMIVTEARVRKLLHKMVDDGTLPSEIKPEDMQIVAKILPNLVYDDCKKEENDVLKQAGEYAKGLVGKVTMYIVKSIISL